jgi:hypothetical protein
MDRAARYRSVHLGACARRVGGCPLKLRGEREIPRVQALVDLSHFRDHGMYVSIVVLLIAAWPPRPSPGLWGRAWIWAAIAQPAEPPDAARLATLTASSRPMEIAAIGYGGLVLILWLMVLKPF